MVKEANWHLVIALSQSAAARGFRNVIVTGYDAKQGTITVNKKNA